MVELRRMRINPPNIFMKRKPKKVKNQSMLGFIKHINARKIQYSKLIQRIQKERIYAPNIFNFTDLRSHGGRIPKTIITNEDYSKYTDFTIIKKDLIEAYTYLYENGGIRLNGKIKTHPGIFIKNVEMVAHSINFFSCEKGSPIMEKILNESRELENYEDLVNTFNRHTEHIRTNLEFAI